MLNAVFVGGLRAWTAPNGFHDPELKRLYGWIVVVAMQPVVD